ncbi:MAG: gamma-glutamyltranspeptidase / glutathione hydrolase [Acidimicrobiaceae bacterium]
MNEGRQPGIVACGHEAVGDAAAAVLRAGGNAFDACLAAGFAGAVAEPCFTSLGGGGFLLAHTSAGEQVLFDFFVDTPGRSLPASDRQPHFLPVNVSFLAADQLFHAGLGSVAVPGCLAGYLHVHARLGRLPLRDIVAPAVGLARAGVRVDDTQSEVLGLLAPILLREPESASIFAPKGVLLRSGDTLTNPDYAAYLEWLAVDEHAASFYEGDLAGALVAQMQTGDGLVTADDLAAYAVIERRPAATQYRGHRILTNPPPSFGGELIALALSLDEARGAPPPWQSAAHLESAVEVMIDVDRRRTTRGATKGTTQMTVADAEGNVASMTTSNGETSGDVVPGTGVLLNNMLGEDDLHPDGFHAGPSGERVASMMAPTLVLDPAGEVVLALGSGGSKRIRTAIAQVITAVLAHDRDLAEAVEAPRVHWDGDAVHVEPGFPATAVDALERRWRINPWPARNLYFGGVHAVQPGRTGSGDPRRGGTARFVNE